MSAKPLLVFVSYAHADEALKKQLRTHLRAMERANRITVWDDRAIDAGDDWEQSIRSKLAEADILLMLFSAAFIESDYCCDVEVEQALARHRAGDASLVPVLIGPCQWDLLPFFKEYHLQMIPRDGAAVTDTERWPSIDGALNVVANELLRVVDKRIAVLSAPATPAAPATPSAVRGAHAFGAERREIPPLLPDLCNRVHQDTAFDVALRAGLKRPTRRPFVFVLYGNDAERHHGFRDRLAQVRIPRTLGLDRADMSVSTVSLDPLSLGVYSDAGEAFRAELGNKLLDNRDATMKELSAYVHLSERPLLITSVFIDRDTLGTLRKTIPGMLDFWSQWPDLPPDRTVMHGLIVRFETRYGESPVESGAHEDVRRLLHRLADKAGGFKDYPAVAGGVLPELKSVQRGDVESWADLPEVKRFSNIGLSDVSDLYKRTELLQPDRSMPMETLYKQIYQLAIDRRT